MAEKMELNETKKATKSTTKKVATGSTKKVIQKRSSSVAGKGTTRKTNSESSKNSNNPKTTSKTSTAAKTKTASALKKNNDTKETLKKVMSSKKVEAVKDIKKVENIEEIPLKKETVQSEKKEAKKKSTKNTKTSKKKEAVEKDNKEKHDQKSIINKQLQEKQTEEIEEAVKKEIKENKKLPSEELGKINYRVFQNICLAIVIMFYLNFVILGFVNIENSIFITDLKVFSMALLIIAIGVIEYAYKKDSGRHTIHGIEILVLAFTTMALIYISLMWADKFIYIVAFITYVFAIYYVAKSIIIYNRMKKEYFIDKMKEIIKK